MVVNTLVSSVFAVSPPLSSSVLVCPLGRCWSGWRLRTQSLRTARTLRNPAAAVLGSPPAWSTASFWCSLTVTCSGSPARQSSRECSHHTGECSHHTGHVTRVSRGRVTTTGSDAGVGMVGGEGHIDHRREITIWKASQSQG